jgi:hypothetical protein
MILLFTIFFILTSTVFAGTETCYDFLNDDIDKNPNIYLIGELHEQDLQKYFIDDACNGNINLGIEAADGGFKSKTISRYTYGCMFKENIFGFEDEALYSLLLLFRERIILKSFNSSGNIEGFKKSQLNILTLLWMSDLMSEFWEKEKNNIYSRLEGEKSKILLENLFHKFMDLKNNKKFKRKVSTNGDLLKSWNRLFKSGKTDITDNLDELLNDNQSFMDVTKAIALSLYESYGLDYYIPCYPSYIENTKDQALGLFCYLKLMDIRNSLIYEKIWTRYCELASLGYPNIYKRKPLVITIGSGHLPELVTRLKKDFGQKVNATAYAYRSSIDYSLESKMNVLRSLEILDEGLFNQDFYDAMELSISFFNSSELRVIEENKDPRSILSSL